MADMKSLFDILGGGEPLFDVTITPKPEQRVPCPVCHAPAESVQYLRANVSQMPAGGSSGAVEFSVRVTECDEVEYLPCGHRFDGHTGELIVHDG